VNQHDLPAGSARKRARLLVDLISQLLDRTPNPFAGLRPHILTVVEDSRYRHPCDAGRLGDIVNG
jgi:hypothetical protein